MLKAVIFDFDGVIVDSHGIINKLFTKIINEEFGLALGEGEFAKYPGMRFEHRLEKISKAKGLALSKKRIEEVTEKGRLEYFTNASSYVGLYPGVIELFDGLKKCGIKLCLGSNGGKKSIENIMERLGITKYFSSVVTYDDVGHGKPSPEMFLKRAAEAKAVPEECIVIDDAIEGIEGAHAAGMKVIALATTMPEEELKDADLVVDSISDLTAERIRELR